MDKKTLRPISVHTSPFALCSTGKPNILVVNDNQKIDMEIFAHLEYLSEIQENSIKRLNEAKNGNGTEDNWKLFRSFIRQAKLFYFSARTQDPSVSALNYFYAYENLVKAYCSLYFPTKVDNKIQHGLSTGGSFSDDFNQEITIHKDGLMALFYKLVTDRAIIVDTKITNKKLVPYCTDISYENQLANPGFYRKILLMKASLGGESDQKISLIIAIGTSLVSLEKNKEIMEIIKKHFDLVDMSQLGMKDALEIPLNERRGYTYFQSKEDFNVISTEIISSNFYKIFFPFVTFYPRNLQERFYLNIPIEDTTSKEIIMNEYLSIFILMFYMSELVRYHPKTIQDNLSKPFGWLMERFTVNTPQTFLRYMVNLIRGEDFIFD